MRTAPALAPGTGVRGWDFVIQGAVIGGLTAVYGARSAVPLIAMAAAAITLLALGWRTLTGLLIGLTFVTVVRVEVLGVRLRPEHFMLFLAFLAVVHAGRGRRLAAAAGDRTVVLFGFFVVWSAVISILKAPQPIESLQICGWLALDWLLLVLLVGTHDGPSRLARAGLLWAGVAGAVAVMLWVSGRLFGTTVGMTPKLVEEVPAASGLSYEANLLGATMAVWAFVAIVGVRSVGRRATNVVFVCVAAALAVSFTRAALVGLACGLIVWAALGGPRAVRKLARVAAAVVVATALLSALAPATVKPLTATVSKLLDFGSGTGRQRAEGWRTAVADIKGFDWVTGLGTNSFGQRHLDPTLPTTPTPAYLANLPLQVLYDTGTVGVAILGATLLSLLTRRRLRDGRAPGLITVYIICASATSPFWYGTTWILAAIAVLDRRASHPEREPRPVAVE